MTARLIYVVGASGSGKDSLMSYARSRLANESQVVFAHRYITRSADAGGENHVALTQEEFDSRRRAGLMAMHWESHGHAYGLGIEVNQWLAKGITVVVNGSREYLETAAQRYPELVPVWIEVSPRGAACAVASAWPRGCRRDRKAPGACAKKSGFVSPWRADPQRWRTPLGR